MLKLNSSFARTAAITIVLLVACAGAAVSANATPLILPGPKLEPGKRAWLETVAPRKARSCSLSLRGGHRSYGPYRVKLGGPTRLVRWTAPRSARGTWEASFSCRTGGRRSTSLGHYTRKVIMRKAGRSQGRLVKRGSVRTGRGSIPEMPSEAPRAQASIVLPSSEEDLDDTRPGLQWQNCSTSKWMFKTRAIGESVASKVEFAPSKDARDHAWDVQLNPITGIKALSEDYGVYKEMWEDFKACQPFPAGLTGPERHAMYEQMACHAFYGVNTDVGGNTWSFEAWLQDLDWSQVLLPTNHCQWGKLDPSNSTITGFLKAAQGQHIRSSLQEGDHFDTWLIGDSTRRRVTTFKDYDCLVAHGNQARLYPGEFLNDYLATRGTDVTTDEACGPSAPPPPAAVKLSITGTCTTAGGTLTGVSSGFTPGGTATIRAWYPDKTEYTNLAHNTRVAADGSIIWRWPCQGDPAGTYTTSVVDDTSGASTGQVAFMIGAVQQQQPPIPTHRVNSYDNYGGGAAGHAMCRGNPGRPESMPGGTATQTFIVPAGVGSIDRATVQIDPDSTVTAHAQLAVNGSPRASSDAAAAGDTTFGFGAVAVGPGDQVSLSISFTASFGKIITVYTVGSPGGTFTASNSCPDGAPSLTTGAGLRAVVSGMSS